MRYAEAAEGGGARAQINEHIGEGRGRGGASNAYAWASLYLPPQRRGFSLGASSARRIVAQP